MKIYNLYFLGCYGFDELWSFEQHQNNNAKYGDEYYCDNYITAEEYVRIKSLKPKKYESKEYIDGYVKGRADSCGDFVHFITSETIDNIEQNFKYCSEVD
jgi:hypothetical protein